MALSNIDEALMKYFSSYGLMIFGFVAVNIMSSHRSTPEIKQITGIMMEAALNKFKNLLPATKGLY